MISSNSEYQNVINQSGHPIALVSMVTTLCETRLFTWAISELMNTGGKQIDLTISVTATDYLYQNCADKLLLRTETKLSFRAFRVERQVSGEPAYLPGIRL